jgi:formate/nitrite transporter FocA (FNT family)
MTGRAGHSGDVTTPEPTTESHPSGPDDDDDGSGLRSAFDRTVAEGEERLNRTWPGLLATGVGGGIDVGFGLFALLLVKEATGNELLGALAFGIGFIALTLANSELFTENYLVPVAALVAGRASPWKLVRLWGGTLVLNLAGGWILTGLIMSGFPKLHQTAVEVARHYPEIGTGWRSFAGAILGGAIITLMTWLERSTPSVPAKLVAAVSAAFLLAAAPLNHVIVVSLEMFAALQAHAPFGYLDWLVAAAWYTLGNMIGGMLLVTSLRLTQVGIPKIAEQRSEAGRPTAAADYVERHERRQEGRREGRRQRRGRARDDDA